MARRMGTVVIASANDGHARTDKTMAKQAGAALTVCFERGDEALAYLEAQEANLLICDERLADMDGLTLLERVRLAPRLQQLPVLMAATARDERAILSAIAAGCHGYVVRPYSLAALERQMRQARRNTTLPGATAVMLAKARALKNAFASLPEIEEADEATSRTHAVSPARGAVERGMGLLLKGRFPAAISAFHQALNLNAAYAEAHEGLARAYKGIGDLGKYFKHMRKAVHCLAEQDRFFEVRVLFAELRAAGAETDNPFYALGKRLWLNEDYAEALLAWRKALKLTPESAAVAHCLARAYCIVGQDERAREVLDTAREHNAEVAELETLLASLHSRKNSEAATGWLETMLSPVKRAMRRLTTAA